MPSVGVCEVVRSTSVCLSVRSHLKNHTPKFHQIFRRCYLWLWLGPPLSSDGSTYYVLSVFWVTSWFHLTEPISQNQMQVRVCFLHFAMWRHRGRSLPSPTASCKAFFCYKECSYAGIAGNSSSYILSNSVLALFVYTLSVFSVIFLSLTL